MVQFSASKSVVNTVISACSILELSGIFLLISSNNSSLFIVFITPN